MITRQTIEGRINSEVYASLPCTREAIDAYNHASFGPTQSPRYPDEWYFNKNARLLGVPSGALRFEKQQMVWVPYEKGTT